jgi:hypothetical protein
MSYQDIPLIDLSINNFPIINHCVIIDSSFFTSFQFNNLESKISDPKLY